MLQQARSGLSGGLAFSAMTGSGCITRWEGGRDKRRREHASGRTGSGSVGKNGDGQIDTRTIPRKRMRVRGLDRSDKEAQDRAVLAHTKLFSIINNR